jgi:ribose-phosphate pyrophosphokinase
MSSSDLRLVTGNANPRLARDIAKNLGLELTDAEVGRFADGEIRVKVNESVRGADVFVVQSTCPPVSENLMELLIIIDALRRASAKRTVAVIPYYGYARQEKKSAGREPITGKLVANLITAAGADRILAMDLHVPSIQGFFDLPVDHLPAAPILAGYLLDQGIGGSDTVVVSPDVGGVGTARMVADRMRSHLAIIAKRRPTANHADIIEVIGDLEDKRAVFMDDIIDTGGSLVMGAEAVAKRGAAAIYACATHAVLSRDAPDRLQNSCIERVVVTDTIPLPPEKKRDKITILSVAPTLADAIMRVHEDQSVSTMFQKGWRDDKR